ncbi:MAG: guanylate kinase [Planctomycetota bacterium]
MNGGGTGTGKLVVISGPSGSGKTTVCNRLLSDPNIMLGVSATTRAPRPREKDGENYYFISREEFLERVERGLFAEHAEYNGNLYGTPRDWLEEQLAAGRTVLLEIDLQGSAQLWEKYPNGIYIFLDAPGRETAVKRLEGRNTETPEERRRRTETADRERELAETAHFDYKVINDDLDETAEEIRNLIAGGKPAGPTS